MKMSLTIPEQEQLTDRIAGWATDNHVGRLVAFAMDCLRPAAPLWGNFLIAAAPLVNPLSPISVHDLGLLMQEDGGIRKIRDRIEQLVQDQKTKQRANRDTVTKS